MTKYRTATFAAVAILSMSALATHVVAAEMAGIMM